MSQLLVTVFVTSDRHNLLISEDVSAVAKLRVSPTAMGKMWDSGDTIPSRRLITGLISTSENETEAKVRKTTHALYFKWCTKLSSSPAKKFLNSAVLLYYKVLLKIWNHFLVKCLNFKPPLGFYFGFRGGRRYLSLPLTRRWMKFPIPKSRLLLKICTCFCQTSGVGRWGDSQSRV